MIKVLFFGRLGDIAGAEERKVSVPEQVRTVDDLRQLLGEDGEALAKALNEPQVMVAVNQDLVEWDHVFEDEDEVAFLPPVTGG
ncbi:MAG: molybdopterin converting factor subunit 1 [Porticoccaceae bacterium]|nr:molybdopterin converting factor subunit 1 [Porticoccaceae bacterium]